MADEKKSTVVPIIASSVAAVAAAFLGSRLGVAGTTAGAGMASMVTMGVTNMVQTGLTRTRVKMQEVRHKHSTLNKDGTVDPPTVEFRPVLTATASSKPFPWKRVLVVGSAVFVVVMAGIFMIELAVGRPISGGNEGTTLTGLFGSPTSHKVTPTTVTEVVTPTTTSMPTTTLSAPPSTMESASPTSTEPFMTSSETPSTAPTLTTTVVPPPASDPVVPTGR